MENLYLITIKRDPEYDYGVEVAGLIEESKINIAKEKLEKFLEEEECYEAEIYITKYIPNQIKYYELEENL